MRTTFNYNLGLDVEGEEIYRMYINTKVFNIKGNYTVLYSERMKFYQGYAYFVGIILEDGILKIRGWLEDEKGQIAPYKITKFVHNWFKKKVVNYIGRFGLSYDDLEEFERRPRQDSVHKKRPV